MSTISTPSPSPSIAHFRPLRIWPAALLLAGMWGAKLAPLLTEDVSPLLFQLAVFVPMLVAIGTIVWWLAASRATRAEKVSGTLGLLLIGIICCVSLDASLQKMGVMFFVLPVGLTGFLGALVLVGWLPLPVRTPLALVATLACFGAWDLLRNDGMTGSFETALHWRWTPTAEQKMLAEKSAQPAATDAPAAAAVVTVEPLGEVTWSEFRGPHRDSAAPGSVIEADWKAHPPKIVWQKSIGPAWSSFSVAGKRLFTQEQRGEVELVTCYSTETGDELWRNEVPGRFWEAIAGAGPRATPTLSGGKLYTQGGTGILQCLDPLTGKTFWKRDLQQEADRQPPIWGFSSSPLVIAGVVVVYAGGKENKGVLAFDAENGEPRWGASTGSDSYASPAIVNLRGKTRVLMVTNDGANGLDPATGKEDWKYDWPSQGYRVLQPALADDSSLLLSTSMGLGTRRLKFTGEGENAVIKDEWTSLDIKPDYNDYVLHKGYLYGFDHNIFTCIDLATGKRKWKQGRYGNGQVLLLPDADQLLVLSEKGDVILLRAIPDKHEELAQLHVIDGKTWNHPVLVGGQLFVRNAEQMARVDLPLRTSPVENADQPLRTSPVENTDPPRNTK